MTILGMLLLSVYQNFQHIVLNPVPRLTFSVFTSSNPSKIDLGVH